MNIHNYPITEEQMQDIARHYGYNLDELEEWQVFELLDRIIDDTCN